MPTFTDPVNAPFVGCGNGAADANSIPGDPAHILEVTNDNTSNQCVRVNSYGEDSFGNNVHFCRYYGTLAAPLAIKNGAFLMSTGYRGYTGSSLSQSRAAFQVIATGEWSATSQGARFQWEVASPTSASRTHMMELDHESLRVYGNLKAGAFPNVDAHCLYKDVPVNSGIAVAYIGVPNYGCAFYGVAGGTANFAKAGFRMSSDGVTNRSISVGGTVNASGADYAEYMRKAADCGDIPKGAIVGIDANGQITDQWQHAVSFGVKSTDPSYVGGDTWGHGLPVQMPAGLDADNDGSVDDAAIARYNEELAAFENALEAARATVDRIAFAGQVPVNVKGAWPGDYIVPVQNGGLIDGKSMRLRWWKPWHLASYMRAVGKVVAIEQDGRARIVVKVC